MLWTQLHLTLRSFVKIWRFKYFVKLFFSRKLCLFIIVAQWSKALVRWTTVQIRRNFLKVIFFQKFFFWTLTFIICYLIFYYLTILFRFSKMSLGVINYLNFLGKCITCIVEITIHSFYNVRGNNFDSSTRSVSLRKEKTNVRIF